ncbi:MAG: aminoglycoside phosphotransferase [Actinomycetota bacterium]|nr:aminoglycoside phosphotransferase [Actinomycetota bacterium]
MIDTTALQSFLERQRWFSGKGRGGEVVGVQTVGWLRRELPAVRIALVDVRYRDGVLDTFQLPLVHYPHPVDRLSHAFVAEERDGEAGQTWLYDALHDKDVTGLWLEGIDAGSGAGMSGAEGVSFHRAPGEPSLPVGAPSIVIGAEQSNTSLIFGDLAILKVFRRVSPGLNPDIEVHDALARAGSTHVAQPLGWVEGCWQDRASGQTVNGSLAMAQCFLRNSTEGWELAKTSVRDLLAEGDLHADEVGGDFAGEAWRLGRATAEVHADLARTLLTGTFGSEELRRLAHGMRARLDAAAAEVEELPPYVDALRATFDELAALDALVPVQRIHGDFHLGQVMRTLDGWKLLDFEGEPAKSLEERRALDSPIRDVAGMLRSFDYAAHHLLYADERVDPQREYRATEWAERNKEAFCDGYAAAAGRDPRESGPLLRAFETDKAVYEAVYEARNRPTWKRIPLTAIERLASAGQRRTM